MPKIQPTHQQPAIMPFGKYKGELLCEVPTDYLTWVLDLSDLRDWLRKAIHAELDRRETELNDDTYYVSPFPTEAVMEVANAWHTQMAAECQRDPKAVKVVNRGHDLLVELLTELVSQHDLWS